MRLQRRHFLMAAGAVALPAVSRIARAQTYPTRPVRIIVGFAAGGTTDITARLTGQWLSERCQRRPWFYRNIRWRISPPCRSQTLSLQPDDLDRSRVPICGAYSVSLGVIACNTPLKPPPPSRRMTRTANAAAIGR
jgi:hypothetical protein